MSIQVVFLNNVIKIWSIIFLRGDHPTKWWLSHFKAEKKTTKRRPRLTKCKPFKSSLNLLDGD